MLADRPETLDSDTRALQIKPDELACDINTCRQSESGRSDLIEGNSTDNAGQADRTAGFLPDPCHALLVGAHVGPGNIIGYIADRVGEAADQLLLCRRRHARVAEDDGLAAAMRQTGGRVLPRHRPRQSKAFLD